MIVQGDGKIILKIYGKKSIKTVGSLYHKKVGISAGSIITKLFNLNCEYVEYNTYTEDNDLFTWSQAGYGEHLIEGNTIINRNAYIGESGTASASDSSGTGFTVTVSGANWATDLHKNANITMNGATMTIWSNDATHLYGYEWNDGNDPAGR